MINTFWAILFCFSTFNGPICFQTNELDRDSCIQGEQVLRDYVSSKKLAITVDCIRNTEFV